MEARCSEKKHSDWCMDRRGEYVHESALEILP